MRQSYQLGEEGQVDWYEAWAELAGAPTLLQVFTLRSMASGAAFHRAYERATQQAFLEAHEHAFNYFQGVLSLLRYDNLKAAVKKILRGYQPEETARFIAFRSHWHYQSEFRSPYQAHEKGGIESEAGYFRRNHWVPLLRARDLEDLNAQLLAACRADERRRIAGQSQPVGALLIVERAQLLPLAERGFELAELSFPRVDGLGCVRVRTNLYSVPGPAGKTVEVRLFPSRVEVHDEGRCVARHERSYERNQQVLDLEHYLDVLERKPGALAGAKALLAWRERGLWPESYDRLLAELVDRHGKQSGTRQMIQVLSLIKQHGHQRVRAVIAAALSLGCSAAAAIRHLLQADDLVRARCAGRGRRALTLRTSAAGADRLRPAARPEGRVMSAQTAVLEAATIRQQCKALHLPSVAGQCAQLAEQAARERRTHLGYLEALLQAELEDREQRLVGRRLRDAHLPRMKTLDALRSDRAR